MSDIIEAVYENGVIKLKKRLREGEKVIVIVKPREKDQTILWASQR